MPRTQANLSQLRERFGEILGNRKGDFTENRIPELLGRLGLNDCTGTTSKRNHLRSAVHASTNEQIVSAAFLALEILALPLHERDELQELVWDDGSQPSIPARYRRDVARQLDRVELFLDREGFHEVLGALWRVDDAELLTYFDLGPTLRDQIEQHCIQNNDWDALTLFDKLGAYKCVAADALLTHVLEFH